MAKKTFIKLTSPAASAGFAWLDKPDSGHKFSDGKFKVTLNLVKGDTEVDAFLEKFEAACKASAVAQWGKVPEDLQTPLKDGDEIAADKDKPDLKGLWQITPKSKFQPGLVGPDRQPLPEKVKIFGGDLLRASFMLIPYESTDSVIEKVNGKNRKTTVTTYGVSAQLRNVQLLEKRNGGGGVEDDFDSEDDYQSFGKAEPKAEADTPDNSNEAPFVDDGDVGYDDI